MEHTAHVGYIGRIEAAETIDSRQSVTDIEHLPHVLCGACIPARQIQGRELIVPTEDAVEVRHPRCIEAAQIQRLDIIQIIEHGLHVRDVGGIQLIQSGKGRHIGKCIERACGIRICHNLSGPVTGQNELLPIRALQHIGHNGLILCGRSIPGLDLISDSSIAILQLNLGNGRLRCTAGIPRIFRIQLRRGLTGHNHRLPGRRLMIGPLRHLHGDVGSTGILLRHGDLIAIHLHRCDRGLIRRRGNGAVTGTSHGNRPGRIVQRNRHLCGCNKQRTGRLPNLPRYAHSIRSTIRPAIAILRRERCSIGTCIGPGRRAANGHLRGSVTAPGRRLCIAVIRQSPALHRPPHFALKGTATGASTGTRIRTRDRGIGNRTNARHSRQLGRRIVLGKTLHIPITVRLGNVRGRRRRQISVRTNELEVLAQRYLLQLMTAIEHAGHTRDFSGIEVRHIQAGQLPAASEHTSHRGDVRGIQQIQSRDGCCRRETGERTAGIRIRKDLPSAVTGNGQLRAVDIGHNAAILRRRSIPGLCFVAGRSIAIYQFDLSNSRLRSCALVPGTIRCQHRRREHSVIIGQLVGTAGVFDLLHAGAMRNNRGYDGDVHARVSRHIEGTPFTSGSRSIV